MLPVQWHKCKMKMLAVNRRVGIPKRDPLFCYGHNFTSDPRSLTSESLWSTFDQRAFISGSPRFLYRVGVAPRCTFQTLALICSIKEHLFRQVRRTVRFLMQRHSRPVSAWYQEHGLVGNGGTVGRSFYTSPGHRLVPHMV